MITCVVCSGATPIGHEVCPSCVTNAPMRVMVDRQCQDCRHEWMQPAPTGRCPRCRGDNVTNERVRVCGLKRL